MLYNMIQVNFTYSANILYYIIFVQICQVLEPDVNSHFFWMLYPTTSLCCHHNS